MGETILNAARSYACIRLLFILTLLVCFAALMVACGGGSSSAPTPLENSPAAVAGNSAAIAEVLAAPVPEGVDPALWDALTQELAAQLSERTTSDLGDLPVNWWPRSSGMCWDDRFMFCDGNGDGVVDIADLTPIAMYYGRLVGGYGSPSFADYNQDGRIDVRDITPLAFWYGLSCGGFSVEFSSVSADSGFARVKSLSYDDYDTSSYYGFRKAFFVPCDTRTSGPLWIRLSILDRSLQLIGKVVYEVEYIGNYIEASPSAFTVYQTNSPSPSVSWSTMSLMMADGNQDGVTNYFDIGALYEAFGINTREQPRYLVADYIRDGSISITDTTGFVFSYFWSISRFQVEVSTESAEVGFVPNGSVDFFASRGFNEFGFRYYEYEIISPPLGPFWVRVLPYSFSDLPGTPSNAIAFGGE